MIRWPWTSLSSLNLDWILAKMKELIEKVDAYADNVTASATTGPAGSSASVTVTGDLDTGLDFAFTIPRGNTGATGADGQDGAQGPEGPEGPPGESFKILGLVATTGDLPANPSVGDSYAVGTSGSNTTYVWNGSTWQNIGSVQALQSVEKQMTRTSPFTTFDLPECVVRKRGDGALEFFIQIVPSSDTSGEICTFSWDTDIPYNSKYRTIIGDFYDTTKLNSALFEFGAYASRIQVIGGTASNQLKSGKRYIVYAVMPLSPSI